MSFSRTACASAQGSRSVYIFRTYLEEKVEVASVFPQERSQQRTVEEIVNILVPQNQEQSGVIPQERVSERTV